MGPVGNFICTDFPGIMHPRVASIWMSAAPGRRGVQIIKADILTPLHGLVQPLSLLIAEIRLYCEAGLCLVITVWHTDCGSCFFKPAAICLHCNNSDHALLLVQCQDFCNEFTHKLQWGKKSCFCRTSLLGGGQGVVQGACWPTSVSS